MYSESLLIMMFSLYSAVAEAKWDWYGESSLPSFPLFSLAFPFLSPPLAGSGAKPQLKSILMHFSLKIWHLVATVLMISLRINCPNLIWLVWRHLTKFQIGMAAALSAIPLLASLSVLYRLLSIYRLPSFCIWGSILYSLRVMPVIKNFVITGSYQFIDSVRV